MSGRAQFKARFSTRMPNGDYLSLTVWPGKSDSTAEILTVQIRRQSSQGWETAGRLAVYRTADGRYSQLPERQPLAGAVKSEPIDLTQPDGDSRD
jgi:hypothetical protein